jgi:hypothetical protein
MYEPKLEQRLDYLGDVAEAQLGHGALPAVVAATLAEVGLSAEQAREIVSVRARKLRRAARHDGLTKLLSGAGIGLFGSALLFASIVLASYAGFLVIWPLSFGLLVTIVGVRLVVSGSRRFAAGREEP